MLEAPNGNTPSRSGLYYRVIEEGAVSAGDPAVRLPAPRGGPMVVELFRAYYESAPPEEVIQRLLEAHVAERARRDLEEKRARSNG